MSGRHVSASELLRLGETLSTRELRVLELLAALSVMSGQQLRRTCFAGEGAGRRDGQVARRVLLRLTRRGLLVRLKRRIGGVKGGSDGFTYRLGSVGQRLVDAWSGESSRRRRSHEPGERFLQHRLAVSEQYVRLHEAAATGQLMLGRFEGEPACWRRFTAPLRGVVTLKPDALVCVGAREWELWWFVEVDLGTVSQATRARQAAAYRGYWRTRGPGELMPRVLWITADAAGAQRAEAAIQPSAEPVGLFVVTRSAQLLDSVIDRGGRS
jgi:hypothetical protein